MRRLGWIALAAAALAGSGPNAGAAAPDKAPDQARAAVAEGESLLADGKFGEAAAAFARAVVLDPGLALAWYDLGYARRRLGDCPRAVEAYQRFSALEPGEPDPHYGVGLCRHAMGDRAGAAAALRRYVEMEKRPASQRFVEKARALIADLEQAPAVAPAATPPVAAAGAGVPVSGLAPPALPTTTAPTAALAPPLPSGFRPAPAAPAPRAAPLSASPAPSAVAPDAALPPPAQAEAPGTATARSDSSPATAATAGHPSVAAPAPVPAPGSEAGNTHDAHDSAEAHFRTGVEAILAERFTDGGIELAVALRIDPQHDGAKRAMDLLRARLNRGIPTRDPAEAARAAREHGAAMRWALSEAAADAVIASGATAPEALLLRGRARMEQGDARGARRDLERALALAPDRPEILRALADVKLAEGDPAGAAYELDLLAGSPSLDSREARRAVREARAARAARPAPPAP